MPRRDWLRYGAFGLAAIAVLAAGLFWLLWEYQKNQAYERQEAASYNAERTYEQGYNPCDDVASVDYVDCVLRADQSIADHKYTDYDLKAQQDMAAWAFGMLSLSFVFSIIGLIVTTAGVIFVARTLTATRHMAAEASRATELQHRTWLQISTYGDRGGITVSKGKITVRLILEAENIGDHPAVHVERFCIAKHRKGGRLTPDAVVQELIDSTVEHYKKVADTGEILLMGKDEKSQIEYTMDAEMLDDAPGVGGLDPISAVSVAYGVFYKSTASRELRYTVHFLMIRTMKDNDFSDLPPKLMGQEVALRNFSVTPVPTVSVMA